MTETLALAYLALQAAPPLYERLTLLGALVLAVSAVVFRKGVVPSWAYDDLKEAKAKLEAELVERHNYEKELTEQIAEIRGDVLKNRTEVARAVAEEVARRLEEILKAGGAS